ncbi:hypothetical protein BsWGS_15301 [Bradybaena similaris]
MSQLLTDFVRNSHHPEDRQYKARKRWNLLAQVLAGETTAKVDNTVSVRRFQSYGLFSTEPMQPAHQDQELHKWFQYTCHDLPGFSVNISHVSEAVTAERLNGFNNTGNVCVWPSEEVMTYYCMQRVEDFKGQRICELGGGMTCLAGVALGLYAEASHLELTDGNEQSVTNLWSVIEGNDFGATTVNARLLRWGKAKVERELESVFDTVICADCLFFDDCRDDLASLIYDLLKPGGQALIFAPSRSRTFHKFVGVAEKLFQVMVDAEYDKRVWNLHQAMLKEYPDVYDDDLHFPIMMKLTKPLSLSRDVTPESR